MKRKNHDKINKIVSIILLFLWCLLIFYFSSQIGINSRESSSRILMFLNSILRIFSPTIDLTKSSIAIFIVRKLAHMFLYFILFIISYYVSLSYKIKKRLLFCFIFCFLYATSDEIHQLFVFERSFGVTDILIDLFGSLIGLLFLQIIKKRNHKISISY